MMMARIGDVFHGWTVCEVITEDFGTVTGTLYLFEKQGDSRRISSKFMMAGHTAKDIDGRVERCLNKHGMV